MTKQTLPKKFDVRLHYGTKVHIQVVDGKYLILETDESYEEFQAAYEAAHSHDSSALTFFSVAEIVRTNPKRYKNFSAAVLDSKTRRMFFSYDESDNRELLLGDYLYFRRMAKKYRKDKNNFYKAYNFLMYHPLFWRLEGEIAKTGRVSWNTNQGLEHAWHSVYKDKNGKVVHTLEVGKYLSEEVEYKGEAFTLPARLSCHDSMLDVIGLTYEEAVILLAKRVYKNYNSSGNLRSQKDETNANLYAE